MCFATWHRGSAQLPVAAPWLSGEALLGAHLTSKAYTHVRFSRVTSRPRDVACVAANPKDHCHYERNDLMEAFLSGRPDRAWLSSIVGPTGSLVDLYRHASCYCYPWHSGRNMGTDMNP